MTRNLAMAIVWMAALNIIVLPLFAIAFALMGAPVWVFLFLGTGVFFAVIVLAVIWWSRETWL